MITKHGYPTVAAICVAVMVAQTALAEVKKLNNLVSELLVVSPSAQPTQSFTFTNPRDGWVFISSNATTTDGSNVHLVVDSDNRDAAVIVHGDAERAPLGAVTARHASAHSILETMRYLPSGEHTLNVYSDDGATLHGLVVRAIPEIFFPEIGFWSIRGRSKHQPFNWEFLTRIGVPDNVNVVNERNFDNGFNADRWRRQGKRIFTAEWTHDLIEQRKRDNLPFTSEWAYEFLSRSRGLTRPDRDGIIMSEFDGYGTQDKEYPALADAVTRLSQASLLKGKSFYPYTVVLHNSETGTAFVKEIMNAGSRIVEERYMSELPSEEEADSAIQSGIGDVMRAYQKAIPDAQKHMLWALGYMSAPTESLNTNPAVNFKVYLDKQFNFIANDPSLAGLYGIMCYHSAYADEETVRWSVRLFRHYCIEGRTEMLSSDPYLLPHLANPDFADGANGWTLSPAEEGSIAVKTAEGYGRRQTRYQGQTPEVKGQGDSFLWTKRSAARPNVVSQEIKNLEPGRLYSLKLFTADYQALTEGTSSQSEPHVVGIQIENASLIPYKSFRESFASDNLSITYHFLVFRATSDTSSLTISDWMTDQRVPWPAEEGLQLNISAPATSGKPAGSIGQELIHNFVELQPYLED